MFEELFKNFEKYLKRLEEILQKEKN